MRIPSFTLPDFHLKLDETELLAEVGALEYRARFTRSGDCAKLASASTAGEIEHRWVEFLFASFPQLRSVQLETADGNRTETREEFFQRKKLWAWPSHEITTEAWLRDTLRPHPQRHDRKSGLFYQRFVPAIGKTISLRGVDVERDLATFHQWQNQPRVAFFWELALGKEELREYLLRTQTDPHMIPVFVELEGQAVGYFELYWTLEDRLGPYYDADAFDRGFHFLIGEKSALGFANTDAIVKSVLHFLFLDDPRTRRVMAEPRHDNKKVLRYAESSGWRKLKEFDFPHKRAALLECRRENFFNGERL